MLNLKLNISSNTDFLTEYSKQYTGLFYIIYNNLDLISDKSFKNDCLNKFNLFDVSMLDSCISEAKIKFDQFETQKSKKIKEIEEIEKILKTETFTTKYERRYKYKLINKLAKLKRNLDKNITFGGKHNLRKITKYKQQLNSPFIENKEEIGKLLEKYHKIYQEKRNLGIYIIGRASDKGNRKFNFDLKNNKIIFKPSKENHFEIKFKFKSKKTKELLFKLQEMTNNKEIPLSIRLTKTEIHIMYDELKVNNYHFDIILYKQEIKNISKEQEEERKIIAQKYCKEQQHRMLKNKLSYRYASVDLNPEEIGLSIVDKKDDEGNFNIIYTECVSLKKLNKKLGLKSDNKKVIKQNNKRKHEIKEVWKHIFKLISHYKVGYFIIEDLDFKSKNKNNPKEFNRKVKNLWHRTLTTSLITKYCNIDGLIKVVVNPCYSSFVGNLCYNYYDPISSSLEIVRRGIVKYKVGNSLYPNEKQINQERLKEILENSDLSYLLGENGLEDGIGFNKLYKLLTNSGLSYRNKSLKGLSVKNLSSRKSKVLIYN